MKFHIPLNSDPSTKLKATNSMIAVEKEKVDSRNIKIYYLIPKTSENF